MNDKFQSYTYGEGRTGGGQAVEFTCLSNQADTVRAFLLENVRSIDRPTTGRVNIGHGEYGSYTRYEVTQYDYAGGGPGEGGGGGYIEVLEIKNPPDERWGIVINEYRSYSGGVFTEWDTLENARAAWKKYWGSHDTSDKFSKLPGFKRRVLCGALSPWFYAIGDELIVGDYTFPDGLQDDAVYRFGRKFVVFDSECVPALKTCMGTRFTKQRSEYHPHKEYQSRLVYWDDGSCWDENSSHGASPRPAEDGELWIVEAVQQFRQLLAGKSTEFSINFTDGSRFVGRLKTVNRGTPCAEGNYFAVVHVKGKKDPLKGWVSDFKPTKEAPDIVQYITQRLAAKGNVVERIEIKESKTKSGGKKWGGVFHSPPK